MTEQGWLVEKSALARLGASPDARTWAGRIERGLVQVATATLLEVGYSARSGPDWADRVHAPPISLMPVANLTPAAERRAVEVQGALARQGQHRGPAVPDLLVAATAETEGSVVLHLDKALDVIAGITGQPLERLVTEP